MFDPNMGFQITSSGNRLL